MSPVSSNTAQKQGPKVFCEKVQSVCEQKERECQNHTVIYVFVSEGLCIMNLFPQNSQPGILTSSNGMFMAADSSKKIKSLARQLFFAS